ncbi:MAG TPA: beta-ketoacyl-[acyl-carrier-protein] synthase family protein [Acidimicrobiia bacterium]|jgi:3-oxoacyl-[acyl-carrier-protein] synthase II|nr:beta-ketoacyl-[acyl-carrier-protein] synthase family protein [Acidimicrobiia bacterium]
MSKRRVVVTGVGALAAPGIGMDDLWKGLAEQPGKAPRLIPNFDPEVWIPKRESRRLDRFTQFALVAADEAFTQSGQPDIDPNRVTVSVATGIGGLESLEGLVHESDSDEPRVSPFQIPMMMANAAAAAISIKYGFGGQVSTPVVACAAGTQSVVDGLRLLQWGYADVAVVGGTEAAARETAREGFKAARALSPTGYARPFDVDRDGFVMGEGAAVLILEAEDVAEARGAKAFAEVLGGASTADAHHITAPHPEGDGAERAIRLALEDAGLEPSDIVYINAHGTGTDLNDKTEGAVIQRVFGDDQPAVSSIKGATGHGLGASGSIEAAVVVEAIRRKELPANVGLTNQDPEIPLHDIVREVRPWEPGPTISNSFGFGGHNTVLVIAPI